MKILCLADDFPWPEKSGYKIRLGNVVRALAEVGELDLYVRMPYDYDGATDVPAGAPMQRVEVVRGDPPRSTPRMLARWLGSRLPRMLARPDWSSARRRLDDWVGQEYDVVWYGHADSIVELGGVVDAPAIVDLDNLEDQRIAHLRVARAGRRDQIRSRPRAFAAPRVRSGRPAALGATPAAHRPRHGCGHVVQRPGPGSPRHPERDRDPERLRAARGCERRPPRAGPDGARDRHGRPPDLRAEHVDGVWFFVDDVLPRIRAEIPGARVPS